MDCWKLSTSGWLDGCVEGLRAPRLKLEGVKEGGKGGGNRSEDKLTGGADIAASCHVLPKPSDQLAIWQGFGKNHKQTTQSFGSVDQPKRSEL